ncbi:MAG TPA: hypothetical protein VF178_03580, partial [Gemmatimonadaceae bacterium]
LSVAPTVPPEFGQLVDRCLEKDPALRYQTCGEFLEELERIEQRLPAEDIAAPRPNADNVAISSVEAQEIWRRAAQLQNATGPVPPMPPSPVSTPSRRAEPLTAGYRLEQVRDAAREAGIGTAYIDQALVERGLADGSDAAAALVVREGSTSPPNRLLGRSTVIAYEATVPGEMPERDFDLLVGIIQRALNDPGNVSTVGRSLSWSSTDQRKVGVSVLVRDGRTTIHVNERLKELAGGIFGGVMGGVGGPGLGIGIPLAIETFGQPWLIPLFAVSIAGTAYSIARYAFKRVSTSRGKVLRDLTQQLAEQARTSIARRTVGPRSDRKLLR